MGVNVMMEIEKILHLTVLICIPLIIGILLFKQKLNEEE
jgi:hypothetical protein|tara:strand:+ start:864 stop:980 length:117 start_codon:yes stop_codon:yes gene_type:complete